MLTKVLLFQDFYAVHFTGFSLNAHKLLKEGIGEVNPECATLFFRHWLDMFDQTLSWWISNKGTLPYLHPDPDVNRDYLESRRAPSRPST